MAVPYTFATATSSIPLSQLDSNFATAITLGSTNLYLGNTTTSVSSLTLTGSAFNGTVGATTASTGAFTTLSASSTATLSGLTASTALALDASKNIVSVTNTGSGNNVLATSPTITGATLTTSAFNGTVGATTPSTGAFTTLDASGNVTLSGGTANGVAYLNGSKVLTTGSALTFDGTTLKTTNTGALNILANSTDAGTNAGAGAGFFYQANGTYKGGIGSRANVIGAGTDQSVMVQSFSDDIYFNAATSKSVISQIGGTEQMRLTSTGLGIGTSSPAYKLDAISSGNTQVGRFRTGGTATTDVVSFERSDSAVRSVVNYNGSDGSMGFGTTTNHATTFWTNNTEKMRLDTSGNLGLGLTPSAWSGNFKALQIVNGSAFVGYVGNDQTFVVSNAYNDGSWKYKNTAGAGYYTVAGVANGVHAWFIAPSGTAGNAITWTQALTLTANGNQLLGTTTEPTSRKSGNTYQAINSAVIEGTPYITVSTTAVQLSRASGVGIIAMVSGYNTSGGLQGTWLVLVGNGVAVVVSSSDGTATTPIFAVTSGYLTMKTTTGTLSVVAQIFTGA